MNSHQLQAKSGKCMCSEGKKRNVANRDLTVHPMRMPGSIGIASSKRDKSRVGSQGTLCRSEADCKGVKPESRKTLQLQTMELDGLTEQLPAFQPTVSGVVAKKSQAVRLSIVYCQFKQGVHIMHAYVQTCRGPNSMGIL